MTPCRFRSCAMLLEELAYDLPESLISPYPAEDRVSARLMVVERGSGTITHSRFASLGEFLSPGDLLVLNNSKVIPARLEGRKESGGRATVLLVEPFDVQRGLWLALVDASQEAAPGWTHRVLGRTSRRRCWVSSGRAGTAFGSSPRNVFREVLDTLGAPPLPHYIERGREVEESDRDSYQTVYASDAGFGGGSHRRPPFHPGVAGAVGRARRGQRVRDPARGPGDLPAGAGRGGGRITAWTANGTR